jgi:ubiquinone/menaquinone biosynthesis C-methylase UbiE
MFAGGTRQDRLRDPDAVVAVLDVRPGMVVADLGPGAGQFTLRLARAVEPDGLVYGLDARQGVLDDLRRLADDRGITTLRTVLVPPDRLELPESVDLLLVSATYHHLRDRAMYFAALRPQLRTDARVAVLESRREGVLARWQGHHASSPRSVIEELARAGFQLRETHEVVRGYFFGIFEVAGGIGGPDGIEHDRRKLAQAGLVVLDGQVPRHGRMPSVAQHRSPRCQYQPTSPAPWISARVAVGPPQRTR